MTTRDLLDSVQHADIFDLCAQLDDHSIDMILADLPYGTTACAWDTVIPFAPMWAAFKRVIKPRGAIVLTASQPFTSALVMSNVGMFRYEWVWNKVIGTGFLDVSYKPLKQHENILIFSTEKSEYFAQMSAGLPYHRPQGQKRPAVYHDTLPIQVTDSDGWRYPKSIIEFSNADQTDKLHPTQKPVALFRYLIRTYTRPGDLVFDPTCGSGTTAIAAREEGRHYICGDSSAEYVQVARDRLAQPYTPSFMPILESI